MGFFSNVFRFARRRSTAELQTVLRSRNGLYRRCRFEEMEDRRLDGGRPPDRCRRVTIRTMARTIRRTSSPSLGTAVRPERNSRIWRSTPTSRGRVRCKTATRSSTPRPTLLASTGFSPVPGRFGRRHRRDQRLGRQRRNGARPVVHWIHGRKGASVLDRHGSYECRRRRMPLSTGSTSKARSLTATLSNSHYYDFNSTANFYDQYDPEFRRKRLGPAARRLRYLRQRPRKSCTPPEPSLQARRRHFPAA